MTIFWNNEIRQNQNVLNICLWEYSENISELRNE